ncbi:uncharacterized protein [Haliotis cracherodii]|uniref:uncharacterized protein n=1 Tax=Haliotis cracherodii TaxID=6455 RepID=UPI0039E7F2DE
MALLGCHYEVGHPGAGLFPYEETDFSGNLRDTEEWIHACRRCLRRKVPSNARAALVSIQTTDSSQAFQKFNQEALLDDIRGTPDELLDPDHDRERRSRPNQKFASSCVLEHVSVSDWRLHDFDIEIFSADPVANPEANGQMCYSFFGEFGSAVTETLRCMYPVEGGYVRIKKRHLNGDDRLTLCELAVHPKIYENNCSFSQRSPSTFVPFTEMYHTTTPRHEIIGSLKTCMIECTMMWACDGFNFNILDSSNGNGTCEFVSVSLAKLYGKSGWTYYKAMCSETPAQYV